MPDSPGSKGSASPGPWRWDADLRRLTAEATEEEAAAWARFTGGPRPTRVTVLSIAEDYGTAPDEESARLIAAAPQMASLLRDLEWQDGDHGPACPVCKSIAFGFPKRGDKVHRPDCRLHALLKSLP